ncbi:hypothetical protein KC19_9G083400 [Ceratodon purpureus]|uniref:Uncharacterized protein n=1 Tax=Ceratodon purpureus TaxID=3225 RepID=A0A8T0GSX6_CERPU|nr:hypothetical protein KC19_9G083400 [Ceratodon purpureus]
MFTPAAILRLLINFIYHSTSQLNVGSNILNGNKILINSGATEATVLIENFVEGQHEEKYNTLTSFKLAGVLHLILCTNQIVTSL